MELIEWAKQNFWVTYSIVLAVSFSMAGLTFIHNSRKSSKGLETSSQKEKVGETDAIVSVNETLLECFNIAAKSVRSVEDVKRFSECIISLQESGSEFYKNADISGADLKLTMLFHPDHADGDDSRVFVIQSAKSAHDILAITSDFNALMGYAEIASVPFKGALKAAVLDMNGGAPLFY